MSADLILRRKWTLRAHGTQVVFVKKANEHASHVLMKALLWALYLPDYPDLMVETGIGARYRPDVVALDAHGHPRFWGEAGQVRVRKIDYLLRRYRATHFAFAKWNTRLHPLGGIVADALSGLDRTGPVDLLSFPADSAERFFDDQGRIHLTLDDLDWTRLR